MNSKPQYNSEYIKTLFNSMSSSYERVNYLSSFGFTLRWRKQFINKLPKSQSRIRILDMMTGMGETWNSLKKAFPNSEITALDISVKMLEQARIKNNHHFEAKVSILNSDILNNDLPDDHFDLVVSAFGLKTFDEKQWHRLAIETNRILKPGGQFSFIEVSVPGNFVLRNLFKFHLKYIVPVLGLFLLGNPSEYKMLWRYTEAYENTKKVQKIFSDANFNLKYHSYFGGCASGISGSNA